MAADPAVVIAPDGALAPLACGPLTTLSNALLRVDVAAQAGGRIAQIHHRGVAQLLGPEDGNPATIAWGSFPMAPWVGRIRHGRFHFAGRDYRLPANFGGHAIHGVAFALPWTVEQATAEAATLVLALPQDARWPFGGQVRQQLVLDGAVLHQRLEVTAGAQAMPVTLGWHPWFRKPHRLEFHPEAIYPRDADGIAVLPLAPPPPGPWDDCFVNRRPVVLHGDGTRLRLDSDCEHWVVFDELAHTTCVEPQSGPPDAPTLAPRILQPGETAQAWMRMEWLP